MLQANQNQTTWHTEISADLMIGDYVTEKGEI